MDITLALLLMGLNLILLLGITGMIVAVLVLVIKMARKMK